MEGWRGKARERDRLREMWRAGGRYSKRGRKGGGERGMSVERKQARFPGFASAG